VVPLFLYDRAVGAVCVERSPAVAPFSGEERRLLLLLAHQVPVSLELARLMAEREQLQTSLQQAQKMEAVGQLAGGIAHDFNNMLTAVRVSLDAIGERAGLDGEVAAELQVISDATQRAGRLMRQLLGFSRHQAVTLAPCVVNDLITQLAPMLRRLAGNKVTISLKLDSDAHAAKIGRASFDQAMVNLVVNARDAMPMGGSVTVESRNVVLDETAVRGGAARAGEYVSVEITDTGQGISPENLSRIFDPFFTTKPLGSGTGIGLTTVYAFVKNCGGHIEVSSQLGRGTTFRIYFPKAGAERAEDAKIPSGAPPSTLVVLDEEGRHRLVN
jgi:two-component system cell cycle sensor histidine kinase/response regulator CckA